jgi:nucleotide-binding universal stress UspA family protein
MSAYQIQRIVVPIDLSETSLNALDTAVALAQKHGATLQLLNVNETGFDPASDDVSFPSQAGANDVLNALAGAIQHSSELKPEVIQQEGNVTEAIIRHSLESHCDLIVMGTSGASGHRNGFVGTNAYSVMKHAGCPVLIIPPKRKFLSFKKLLFPIRPVTGALQRYDVVCHLLSGYSSLDVLGLSYRSMEKETGVLEKIIDEIKDKLEIDRIKPRASWSNGNIISEDVLEFAQQNNSDLIVVTSVLDVTIKPNFIGPHSQKIINCSKVPVLSIKKVPVPSMA